MALSLNLRSNIRHAESYLSIGYVGRSCNIVLSRLIGIHILSKDIGGCRYLKLPTFRLDEPL